LTLRHQLPITATDGCGDVGGQREHAFIGAECLGIESDRWRIRGHRQHLGSDEAPALRRPEPRIGRAETAVEFLAEVHQRFAFFVRGDSDVAMKLYLEGGDLQRAFEPRGQGWTSARSSLFVRTIPFSST
jgi:hypothetical protein